MAVGWEGVGGELGKAEQQTWRHRHRHCSRLTPCQLHSCPAAAVVVAGVAAVAVVVAVAVVAAAVAVVVVF